MKIGPEPPVRWRGGLLVHYPWPKAPTPEEELRKSRRYRDRFLEMIRMAATFELSVDGNFWFWCPGCHEPHRVPTKGEKAWALEMREGVPTLSPSLLVHGWKAEDPKYKSQPRCHSFVRAGRIEFLGDCEHALAGQTVDLPPWNDQPYGNPTR